MICCSSTPDFTLDIEIGSIGLSQDTITLFRSNALGVTLMECGGLGSKDKNILVKEIWRKFSMFDHLKLLFELYIYCNLLAFWVEQNIGLEYGPSPSSVSAEIIML